VKTKTAIFIAIFTIILTLVVIFYQVVDAEISSNKLSVDVVLNGDGCVVLNYHRIGKINTNNNYNLSKDDFKNHINNLIKSGANFINMDKQNDFLHRGIAIPKKSIL
jgi:hypothetical protein